MLGQLNIENILFLDIETVPAVQRYGELTEPMRRLWDRKAAHLARDGQSPEDIYERAGIYAEFGRIICISVGYITKIGGVNGLRIKSFYGDDEKGLLSSFADLLNRSYSRPNHVLCAHNGKEFDFPYTARRMIVNSVRLPSLLDIAGKKPWEVGLLDTMELWKFGDYKSYTSLALLTAILNIPTPKDDIEGSDVARVYYEEKDLERIVSYCQKDVLAVVQLVLRFKGEALIEPRNVNLVG